MESKSWDRRKHWLNFACVPQPTQATGREEKPYRLEALEKKLLTNH